MTAAVAGVKTCPVDGCARPRNKTDRCALHERLRTRFGEPWIALAARVSRGIPPLHDAACRGRHDVFNTDDSAAIAEAVRICRRCPALGSCREWSNTLPRNRIHGVVAGRRRNGKITPTKGIST